MCITYWLCDPKQEAEILILIFLISNKYSSIVSLIGKIIKLNKMVCMENNEDYKPTINISFDDYYDVIITTC